MADRKILKYKDGTNIRVPITEIGAGSNITIQRIKDTNGNDTDQVVISSTAGGGGTTVNPDIRGINREVQVNTQIDILTLKEYKEVRLDQALMLRDAQLTFGSTITGTIPSGLDDLTLFMHQVTTL
jgi:hypothetical protein